MVRLFLAEDEIAMREGIKHHMHWAEEGIEFCGEASDGELAWQMIQEKRPDIVITDIKMPFMDGLQLSALIRRELPETKIVILSGYSQFEYAQEALRLGVTEYLLKPITPRSLREVIRRLKAVVEEEKRQQEERVDMLLEEKKEKEEHGMRSLFRALISEEVPSHQILEMAENISLKLDAPFYQLLLVYVAYRGDLPGRGLTDGMLQALVGQFEGCYLFEHSIDSVAILVTGRTQEDLSSRQEQIREKVIASIRSNDEMHYFISTGRPVRHLSEIHLAYREANRASSYRFFLSPDQSVSADTPISRLLGEDNPNPINTESALQNGNLRNIWDSFLRTGTQEETGNFVDDVFASVGEDNLQSLLFLSYLTMDCFFSMARFIKTIDGDPQAISRVAGDINTVMGTLKNAEDSRNYLKRYLTEVIRLRDGSTSGRNSQLLQAALVYIDEHFTDGELSLNKVSSAVGLSANHFSTLFSHEMGMTFIDYLIRKRMERACELLMTTDLKSFEVAYRSGYNDPHYFSTTFKKLQGMSPMEYRRRGKRKEEDLA